MNYTYNRLRVEHIEDISVFDRDCVFESIQNSVPNGP